MFCALVVARLSSFNQCFLCCSLLRKSAQTPEKDWKGWKLPTSKENARQCPNLGRDSISCCRTSVKNLPAASKFAGKLFSEIPPVLPGIPWPALRGPLRNQFWKKRRPQPYWGGENSGNALEASNALNYRVWGIPAVLSREIPGNALRAFPGSFRNLSGISSGKPQPYWGYGPFFQQGISDSHSLLEISDLRPNFSTSPCNPIWNMAGSRESSRTTSEPPGSYELSASRPCLKGKARKVHTNRGVQMWFANFRANQPCFRLDCRERYWKLSLQGKIGWIMPQREHFPSEG